MRKDVVIFIDQLAPKNKLQIEAIQQFGYAPYCFVNNIKPGSEKYIQSPGKQIVLQTGFMSRTRQVFAFLKKNRHSIHHVELYPGGRFSFMYVVLSRLFGLKTLCVERGDLLYYHKKGYDALTRFSMYCCYRFSNMVWYRELYMKARLEKIRKEGLYFLHNAINCDGHFYDNNHPKDIDFLWLNRVIPERKYKWFLKILGEEPFRKSHNYLVGIMPTNAYSADQEYVLQNKPANLTVEQYTSNPVEYFKRARFFVLPADVVFANNALLEAMSYGVVPLVSKRPGASLIVDDHLNGFVFVHSEEGLRASMQEAINLSDEQYHSYAQSAATKIRSSFSESNYTSSLEQLYRLLN